MASRMMVGLWLVPVGFAMGSGTEDELSKHLATLRRQVDDPSLDIARRQKLVLEMASTLDRAAQAATSAEGRRARLAEAVGLLDEFDRKNPKHPQDRHFRLQAAVYLWAQARSWSQQWELNPTDLSARGHAIEALEAVIGRLRELEEERQGVIDVSAQNVRYRLAQAMADRAGFDPEASADRKRREEEALKVLERPTTEPTLQGFAHLLRGELLTRLGRADAARAAWEAASKSSPAPPVESLLEVRVALLRGQKQFDEALRAIESSKADPITKSLLAIRVRLAQRDVLSGKARTAAESETFRQVEALRRSSKADAQRAILSMARAVREPDASLEPDAWDVLAEGFLGLGDPAHASALEARGADRAEALGRNEQAARLRLRAGAILFQAEKYREADPLLSRVAEDPKAGPSRPRAGLLRALARGRALALRRPETTLKDYLAALEYQIREFGDDPSAGEARWLLGKARLASGDREAAERLWTDIPPGHARWLETRMAMARQKQEGLDNQRLNGDQALARRRFDEARALLTNAMESSRTTPDKQQINLILARLELTPGVGHLDEAHRLAEGLEKEVGQPEMRNKARMFRLVALAGLNRFVEAEQLARAEVNQAAPSELIETARMLDRAASETDSDLRMRRFGLIIRVLMARALERPDRLTADQLAESRIRLCRALLFSGDDIGARKSLGDGSGITSTTNDDLLRDLADAYMRLDAFELAVDAHRFRSQRSATGTLPWLDARYGLALALYRSGKAKESRRLIEATAILHPELGGGELREKFERLGQRLQVD